MAEVPPPARASAAAGGRRRWPLLVIGASAGTATWSGWVGLGELTGFGVVHPLPGIWDALTINSAITLPVGVEAYAVYALAVATDPRTRTPQVRRWAWGSAFGALLLGMAGQVTYHLLTPNARPGTPGWVVALVSCLPVLVLGAASLLWHLTGQDHAPGSLADLPSVTVQATASSAVTARAAALPSGIRRDLDAVEDRESAEDPDVQTPADLATGPGLGDQPTGIPAAVPHEARAGREDRAPSRAPGAAARSFPGAAPPGTVGPGIVPTAEVAPDDAAIVATIVETGTVPSVRQIKADHRVGGSRAVRIRALAVGALAARPHTPRASDVAPDGAAGSAEADVTVVAEPGGPVATSAAPAAAGAAEAPSPGQPDMSPLQAEIEEFLQQIERPEHHGE